MLHTLGRCRGGSYDLGLPVRRGDLSAIWASGGDGRNALIELAVRLLLISQVCSDGRFGFKMVPVHPWAPTLLRHLPTHSTPSLRPDTSRRPGDLPWRAFCRRGAVGRPGTLGSTDVCLIVRRVREDVIGLLTLFDHGHVAAGRFRSFCFWAAVLGVITLNPEATSMFSLFCVVVCVLAQLINSAVHPAAILLRKRRVDGFIDGDLPCYRIRRVLQSRGKEEAKSRWLHSFLCSWLESLAVALHPLQPDSLFCFGCLVLNSSFLLLTFPNTSFASY